MPHKDDETRRAITAAYNRMYREKNRERIKANWRAYYDQNREKLAEKNKARIAAWQKAHPEIVSEHKRRYRERNRDKLREAHASYVRAGNNGYRASVERTMAKRAIDLETMAGRPRPEVCDACGGPPDPKRGMHFDHCHKHGHFRGWLCRECNLALGNVRDDPARLLKLVAYLKRTSRKASDQFSLPGV